MVVLALGLLALVWGGCASPSQVTKKDMSVLMPGVERAVVIDEFGAPVSTTTNRAGNTVDVFTFVQGTAPSNKPPRPLEPEQAEAAEMLLLLEKMGQSPMVYFNGKRLTVQVNYDRALRVEDTVMLRIE